MDNALDAVANSAQALITVEVTADDADVQVTVSDSGPGVSPEAQDKIFDRGFSTKSAAVVGGRGIGLSLVRRICEQRGGAVGVHYADGAVFTAVLPVRAPRAIRSATGCRPGPSATAGRPPMTPPCRHRHRTGG